MVIFHSYVSLPEGTHVPLTDPLLQILCLLPFVFACAIPQHRKPALSQPYHFISFISHWQKNSFNKHLLSKSSKHGPYFTDITATTLLILLRIDWSMVPNHSRNWNHPRFGSDTVMGDLNPFLSQYIYSVYIYIYIWVNYNTVIH